MNYSKIIESGLLPDWLFRFSVRKILSKNLKKTKISAEEKQHKLNAFIEKINTQPIAINESDANEQHYELPTDFFKIILGNRLKYSSCLWDKAMNLNQAEENMLSLCCRRAELVDGQSILELGCGWGSLSLYLAENYPNSQITALSNSKSQKVYIDEEKEKRGFNNLQVLTDNIATVQFTEKFDRIISIEMFEHMRNYPQLFSKVSSWLNPKGRIFIHILSYAHTPYLFNSSDKNDWMAGHFFAGGTMPSHDLFFQCIRGLNPVKSWIVNGIHYGHTLKAWLKEMDKNKEVILPMMEEIYGEKEKKSWWNNWRAFFISCEEIFKYHKGTEWFVSHYLFEKV